MLLEQQTTLLDIAKKSVRYGLDHDRALPIDTSSYTPELSKERASFVTLHIDQQLRGCIGSLVAYRPLVIDVAENAFSAAFQDTRFSPLNEEEFYRLHYHISVLSKPEPILFRSESELLDQLKPQQDGLILSLGAQRATFLPSVWEQLPDKTEFMKHLKIKAGLPVDYWSENLKIERYSVESFEGG